MGGYWGTVVVARAQGLLVDQDGISGFGYEHAWLRELGDGWQLLETTGLNDPPDLRRPCEAVAAATNHPVLAAYVSDSHCAVMCAAVPRRVGPLTHLWDVSGPCGVFRHQPRGMLEPVGRSVDEVVAELAKWSVAAGLRADTGVLRDVVAHDVQDAIACPRRADDLLFDVVKALGVVRIGRTLPWAFPVYSRPFNWVIGSLGLAARARRKASYRETIRRRGWEVDPEQPWEAAAIALETELWSSLYQTGVDAVALARRAVELCAVRDVAENREPADELSPPCLADGTLQPDWEEVEARKQADSRATEERVV